ncbi:TPA: hypothetical protein N0F65_005522 [Lagenidium giganteum]|uniref:Nitric oxide synthase-interacting protein zinc-finger domain-containing protein n=1 Tax=Lagenidium giganteum TaxID=4803 RepID=A0AAV2YCM1_9STRA|nr:TPA: hypothetical protein N0F65_005522 [Lagenidium giganteum]
MSRHSKNSTATTHFTYHERSAAGHGTLKRRYGKDSQLPFGFCCLCVATTFEKEPLVSPSGFLYCKECIYSNLLAQKRSIQEAVDAYERYCEKKEIERQDAIIEKDKKKLQQFLDPSRAGVEQFVPERNEKDDVKAKLSEKVDRRTEEEKRDAMKKTSFWIPECAPTAEVAVEKPDMHTKDPMSNENMKLKHLMPVKFEWSVDGKDKSILCALTKKAITHHQAVLIRPSGQVMLESCLRDTVFPTMTCPISGLKLRKKDIIKLQSGGTGYSAHSNVEAKKYRPSMT